MTRIKGWDAGHHSVAREFLVDLYDYVYALEKRIDELTKDVSQSPIEEDEVDHYLRIANNPDHEARPAPGPEKLADTGGTIHYDGETLRVIGQEPEGE